MSKPINKESSAMEQSEFVANEFFTPALQTAIKQAQASDYELAAIINGALDAYATLMTSLVGPDVAAHMMHDFALHVAKVNEVDLNKPLTDKVDK